MMEVTVNMLAAGEDLAKVIITLTIFLLVEIGMNMLSEGLIYFYFNIKQAKISAEIDMEVYNQIRKVDYKYFDIPDFYNSYTLSYGQYAALSAQAFSILSQTIALIVTIGTLVGYILSSTFYVLIVTLVTVIIKVWVEDVYKRQDVSFIETKPLP